MADRLYMVIPCYNEQEVILETAKRLKDKLAKLAEDEKISADSRVLFVDDGSKDATWQMITKLHNDSPEFFSGLKLSRNRGHQNALLAGLMTAKDICDFTISMDVDLQDDIEAIDRMVEKYHQGAHIVYGVRSDRTTDTAFKRNTAQMFYKLMKFLGVDLVYNHADYRLMSRTALDGLAEFKEVNLFLRGMAPLVGYKSDVVEYNRGERFAGESKYPLKKMLAFAWQGVTSFSTKVFSFITFTGFVTMIIGIICALASLIGLFFGRQGQWVMASIWFVGGMQILFMGILGEYLGKVYAETKQRPRYVLEAFLDK